MIRWLPCPACGDDNGWKNEIGTSGPCLHCGRFGIVGAMRGHRMVVIGRLGHPRHRKSKRRT